MANSADTARGQDTPSQLQVSAARATRPPPGLKIDPQAEQGLSDQAIMQVVQEAVQRRPGPRLPRARRPPPPQALDVPTECKGAGCLIRMRLAAAAEKCKGDRECRKKMIGAPLPPENGS